LSLKLDVVPTGDFVVNRGGKEGRTKHGKKDGNLFPKNHAQDQGGPRPNHNLFKGGRLRGVERTKKKKGVSSRFPKLQPGCKSCTKGHEKRWGLVGRTEIAKKKYEALNEFVRGGKKRRKR